MRASANFALNRMVKRGQPEPRVNDPAVRQSRHDGIEETHFRLSPLKALRQDY